MSATPLTTTSPVDADSATARCPNCQSPILRAYCADCGQKRPDRDDLTLRALGTEAFDELFSADSRLLSTLRSLAIAPGEVIHDWFEGRRARWVAPLKLYLITSALYFFSGAHDALSTVFVEWAQEVAKELGTVVAGGDADNAERLERLWTILGFAGVLIQASLAVVVVVYAVAALRRAYSLGWPRAIGAAIVILGLTQVVEVVLMMFAAVFEAAVA